VAVLPLLGLVLLAVWQGVVLVRQQVEAQSDARELARRAALCARAAPPSGLRAVDPSAAGSVQTSGLTGRGETVRVEVRLVPQVVLPGFVLDAASPFAPRAVVVMRREPC
jgi:hypothetical protein